MKITLIAILWVASFIPLKADSFSPVGERVYISSDRKFLLHVAPKTMVKTSGPLSLDAEDKSSLDLLLGCHASLFDSEGLRMLWRKSFVNEFAPAFAYVSDGGLYVVTVDDAYSRGVGSNVVVIYDSEGDLIKRFTLADFIPASRWGEIPAGTSSILWHGKIELNAPAGQLLIQVWDGGGFDRGPITHRLVKVRLSDGEFLEGEKESGK